MPRARHSSPVTAPVETIWALLLDKIEHPENYVPGVLDCEIVERGTDHVVRRMRSAAFEVVERITSNPASLTVRFELVDHPVYLGTVINVIEPAATPILTFELDWQRHDGAPDKADLQAAIAGAVEHTRDLAEAAAERAAG